MKVLFFAALVIFAVAVYNSEAEKIKCRDSEDEVEPIACPPGNDWFTFYAVPYDCHKFFQCANGNATCFTCPHNLVWNQMNATYGECDWESEVGCVIVTTPRPSQN